MLVITRALHTSIFIDDGVNHEMQIRVLDVHIDDRYGRMVKLGLEFPDSFKIYRDEVAYAKKMGISLDEAREYLYRQNLLRRVQNTEIAR